MFSFLFLFRNNGISEQLDENDFRRCYYQFFMERVILKVQSSFSTTTRHLDNGIWKTPYNWRFYGHGSTQVWSLHQYILLIIISLSFSQTNLVLKFNQMLIEQFSSQFIYLSTFWYSVYLEVHLVPLGFFHKNQWNFE